MKQPRRTDHPSATERLIEHGWSVVIFDGDCVLCSASVRFVGRRSRGRLLAFSALQSEAGRKSLAAVDDAEGVQASLAVLTGDHVLRHSEAVLHLMQVMHPPWPFLARAMGWLPTPFLDGIYTLIARNRYRLFGRRAHCMLAEPDLLRRFVR